MTHINPWWFVAVLPLAWLLWFIVAVIVAEVRLRRRIKKWRKINDQLSQRTERLLKIR